MKAIFNTLLLVLSLLLLSSDYVSLPIVKNDSFQVGEKLRYRITYGFMDAGEAVMEVLPTNKKNNGRELIHLKGTGRTLGGFNAFYKVHDVYESYVDKKGIFPWEFIRRVDEGGYKLSQDYYFKQDKEKVETHEGKDFKIPTGIQDMVSSFYYARTIDFKNLKKGDVIQFKCFMDNEIWPLKIKYVGNEVIHIRKGKFSCMKFLPVVQKGRYFKSENDLNFWITNDENRIPILVRAKIPVGIVKLHLVDWQGLMHPLNKVK